MPHRLPHLRRALAAAGAAALLALPLAGCSSNGSDEEATTTTTISAQASYCAAWDDVVAAFSAFDELDLVGEGLSSVRTYLDDLGDSVTAFADAADAKLAPQVEDFRSSITALGDALAGDADTDLGDAASELRTSWDGLVTALREDCPDSDTGS